MYPLHEMVLGMQLLSDIVICGYESDLSFTHRHTPLKQSFRLEGLLLDGFLGKFCPGLSLTLASAASAIFLFIL